jgi:Winged helix DNA-binding domain
MRFANEHRTNTGSDMDSIELPADIDDGRPGAWLIDDRWQTPDAVLESIAIAGFRIACRMSVSEALDRQTEIGDVALVVLEISEPLSADQRTLITRLDMRAHDARNPMIVACPIDVLDEVAALVVAAHSTILCDPTPFDRVAAIERSKTGIAALGEERTMEAVRLLHLTDEVARIARSLAELAGERDETRPRTVSDGLIGYRAGPMPDRPVVDGVVITSRDVRELIQLRRRRDAALGADLFADPAWDMMLDLMAARIDRLKVAVSSLCIAAAVPATTALRWIKTLTEMGVFKRVNDPTDKRRIFIELSDQAATAVLDVLGDAKRAGVLVV